MSKTEKQLEQKLLIIDILQSAFVNQRPDEMTYGEIKQIIETYRENTKETMSESEKQLIHHILVAPQAKLDEYLEEAFQ